MNLLLHKLGPAPPSSLSLSLSFGGGERHSRHLLPLPLAPRAATAQWDSNPGLPPKRLGQRRRHKLGWPTPPRPPLFFYTTVIGVVKRDRLPFASLLRTRRLTIAISPSSSFKINFVPKKERGRREQHLAVSGSRPPYALRPTLFRHGRPRRCKGAAFQRGYGFPALEALFW